MKWMNFCMIREGNRVVVQDKKKKEGWEGLTFPGGKTEPFESFQDAVIREVKEETGLEIANPEFCGVLQWVYEDGDRDVVFLYRTEEYTGTLLDETDEGPVFWMDWDEFLQADGHAEFMQAYLRVLLDEQVDEAFCLYRKGEDNEFRFYGAVSHAD